MRLRELRKNQKMTMKQLGEMVGVSESAISQYETGKRHADFETLLKFAEIFEVTLDHLLGRTDALESKKSAPEETLDISEIEFALYGELRELDEEDKAELLKNAQRMRELQELRRKQKDGALK